jgi:DNA-binding NtrC family response regulator
MSMQSTMAGTILVVDHDIHSLTYTRTLLEKDHYDVETLTSGEQALNRLRERPTVDLMLVGISKPETDGLQTIEACKRQRPEQTIVAFSTMTDVGTVVKAIKFGAVDYMTKPFCKSQLDAVLRRSLPAAEPVAAPAEGEQEEIESLGDDLFFLAASPAMKQIRAQLWLVAKVDLPVLFLGESGVGKEILARLVHKLSPRSRQPFVKVNCAALPNDLLESELFGYEAGAFTGAARTKPGRFELSNHGTILLDEIGEMDPLLQAKLLHVLQDGQFCRLGSRSTIKADFRALAATNIKIQEAISNKTFREDLYYRLNTFTINIPPLRDRKEEIPLLLKHFTQQFSQKYAHPPVAYSDKLMRACVQHSWRGNLRELGNFAKRHLILQDEALAMAELEARDKLATETTNDALGIGPALGLKSLVRDSKDKTEIKAIEEALIAAKWNRKAAAMRLNISYKALSYKIKQYQILNCGSSGI